MKQLLAALLLLASPLAHAQQKQIPVADGLRLNSTSTPPFSTGQAGIWRNGNTLNFHKTDNTDLGMGGIASIALTMPGIFAVSGSPVTPSSGTFGVTLATETANTGFWGPTTGSAAAPTFRTMVNADLATTNAVLSTDWFVSPVIEMANGLHTGVFASFANHTCGVRFTPFQGIHVTGVRFYWPDTTSKSVKVSLWNKAGTRLATATAAESTAGIKSVSFTSTALTAGQVYYVSGWITDGSLGMGYGVANTDLFIADSQVSVKFPGSSVIMWTGWGADSAGDTFPNGDNVNVICQFDPVYTVP